MILNINANWLIALPLVVFKKKKKTCFFFVQYMLVCVDVPFVFKVLSFFRYRGSATTPQYTALLPVATLQPAKRYCGLARDH